MCFCIIYISSLFTDTLNNSILSIHCFIFPAIEQNFQRKCYFILSVVIYSFLNYIRLQFSFIRYLNILLSYNHLLSRLCNIGLYAICCYLYLFGFTFNFVWLFVFLLSCYLYAIQCYFVHLLLSFIVQSIAFYVIVLR